MDKPTMPQLNYLEDAPEMEESYDRYWRLVNEWDARTVEGYERGRVVHMLTREERILAREERS